MGRLIMVVGVGRVEGGLMMGVVWVMMKRVLVVVGVRRWVSW